MTDKIEWAEWIAEQYCEWGAKQGFHVLASSDNRTISFTVTSLHVDTFIAFLQQDFRLRVVRSYRHVNRDFTEVVTEVTGRRH